MDQKLDPLSPDSNTPISGSILWSLPGFWVGDRGRCKMATRGELKSRASRSP